jgi:hypothetical protein
MLRLCGAAAGNLLLQVDAEALRHAVQRAAIDPEDLRGACPIATHLLDDVKEIAAFDLVE